MIQIGDAHTALPAARSCAGALGRAGIYRRVPPRLPHKGPAAEGREGVLSRSPCAAGYPMALLCGTFASECPEMANIDRPPAAGGSSGLLGTESGQADPI